MKRNHVCVALLMGLISMASCSQRDAKDNDSIKTDTIKENTTAPTATDSVNSDTTAAKKPGEAVASTLRSTQSQIEFMKNSGNWGKYESGVLPQMAEDAPEYCGKILESGKNHFVIVDKAKMHLFLYDRYGNVLKKFPIACAKNYGNKRKKGDSRTTEGYYPAEGVYDSRNWLYTDDYGHTSPAKGVYGPWFIRVVHPIGIHGTSSPGSIGKRCSHGCIRLNNENIKELVKYVDAGTPIIVSPGPRDMAVNQQEGKPTLAVVTEPGTPKAVPGKDTGVIYNSESNASSGNKVKQETTKSEEEKATNVETEMNENSNVENGGVSVPSTPEPVKEPQETKSVTSEE